MSRSIAFTLPVLRSIWRQPVVVYRQYFRVMRGMDGWVVYTEKIDVTSQAEDFTCIVHIRKIYIANHDRKHAQRILRVLLFIYYTFHP